MNWNLRVGSDVALGARTDVVIDVTLGAGQDVDELALSARLNVVEIGTC